MSRTILVTGGTGFIGQALIPVLEAGNNTVRIAGHRIDQGNFTNRRNTGYYHLDLNDINSLSHEVLDEVDTIIHLAARVHIMDDSKSSLEEYRRSNTVATRRLAELAVKAGVRRFIYLSTVKVPGERTSKGNNSIADRCNEEGALAPEDAYAVSKLEAENALVEVCSSKNMEYVILRPPLVYGPGVKANFYRLLTLVYKRCPLPFSMLKNKRSLLFVGNLGDAINQCIDNRNAANQVFLLKDVDITLPELVRKAGICLDRPARLFPVPERVLKFAGRITSRQSTVDRLTESLLVDDKKIRTRLNWSPPYTFDEGLEKTTTWFSKTMEQAG